MKFKKKKVYGSYKTTTCPFCSRMATQKNDQGLDVCHLHTKSVQDEIKCTCGSWLEVRSGKFGPYYNCINCGNINYNKAMEVKSVTMKDKPQVVKEEPKTYSQNKTYQKKERKEITITSDDVEYFD
jgi:hypothetical protein